MNTDSSFWDGIATAYAAKPIKNVAAFERKKAITRAHLRPTSNVLELGCGTGSLALEMAAHARHIDALDTSAAMLRIANERKAARGVANVAFHQGTLDEAPFAHGTFDNVWAYSLLHLVPDRLRTLARVFALLEPGGTFVSSTACLADSCMPYGPAITLARWLGKAPEVHIFGRRALLRELAEAGFVDIVEHDVGADAVTAFVVAKRPRRS